ncbi:MAG: hypothetical protein CL878_01215 [Dehalococcoidia bacterium]|nr:hypothetical protein [Dehalococcoidia bacterium]
MRMLMWHVNSFASRVTERGRSRLAEDVAEPEIAVGEAILVFTSVEQADEAATEAIVARGTGEIRRHAQQLGVGTIVLHSFAHLFGELASPNTALAVLDQCEAALRDAGFSVVHTPFGWFNTLDIQAKGHPLSRVARTITATD